MNNQNPNQQNQNWRQPRFMQDSRIHGMSRPETFYGHYPPSTYVNDYMPGAYVYPGMIHSFRPNQYPIPSMSDECYPSMAMMPPEAYSKYYNKGEPYPVQDPQFGGKQFSIPRAYFQSPQTYRPDSVYGPIGVSSTPGAQGGQLPVIGQMLTASEQCLRVQKGNKGKSVIIIESDEENKDSHNVSNPIKCAPQKSEEKLPKQLTKGMQPEQKNNSIVMQGQQQSKQKVTVPQVQPHVEPLPIDSPMSSDAVEVTQFPQKQTEFKQQIPHQNAPFNQKKLPPNFPMWQPVKSFPVIFKETQERIMHRLEKAEFTDITTEMFLKYKILELKSMSIQKPEQMSNVFSHMIKYETMINFEEEKREFVSKLYNSQIFGLLKQTNGKQGKINNISPQGSGFGRNAPQNDRFTKKSNDNFVINFQQQQNKKEKSKHQNKTQPFSKQDYQAAFYPNKTKKISKKQVSDYNSEQLSFNGKSKYLDKYDQPQQLICERRLRDRKKKKNKKERYEKNLQSRDFSERSMQKEKDRTQGMKVNVKEVTLKQNPKPQYELSHEDEGLIDKIKGWAQKTVLADAIDERHNKKYGQKGYKKYFNQNEHSSNIENKHDPFRVIKKHDSSSSKKVQQRSSKQTQQAFRSQLSQKITQSKTSNKQPPNSTSPNLITFTTSTNLSGQQKQEYQRQLAHLVKEMRNNDSHGKIRIGKEYFQAKMPNFIKSDSELKDVIREKRERLMERKMTVLTF